MFRQMAGVTAEQVEISLDGERFAVPAGVSLAAAMLIGGAVPMRASTVAGAPRAAYCMIGHCYECLVEVDGAPGMHACLTTVRAGMVVRRQLLAAETAHD